MNYQRENQSWVEVLKGERAEEEVECEGEKGALKKVLQIVKINQKEEQYKQQIKKYEE